MALGGAAPDIAERSTESASLFRALFEANILGVTIVDERRIVEANDAFLKAVGRTRAELLAGRLEWAAMTPPAYVQALIGMGLASDPLVLGLLDKYIPMPDAVRRTWGEHVAARHHARA